ncbi:unnamed protein product, partial [Prorocentrum cordatum]
ECYAAFCKSFHATGEAANGFPEASADADGEGGQGGAAADGVGAEPGGQGVPGADGDSCSDRDFGDRVLAWLPATAIILHGVTNPPAVLRAGFCEMDVIE